MSVISYLVMNSQLLSFISYSIRSQVIIALSLSLSLVFFYLSQFTIHNIAMCVYELSKSTVKKEEQFCFIWIIIINKLMNTIVTTIIRPYGGLVTVYGPEANCKMRTGKWFHRINGFIQLNLKSQVLNDYQWTKFRMNQFIECACVFWIIFLFHFEISFRLAG